MKGLEICIYKLLIIFTDFKVQNTIEILVYFRFGVRFALLLSKPSSGWRT